MTSFSSTVVLALMIVSGPSAASELLMLEAKIPLGNVAGRIDHLAVDLDRGRLIIAELGNNTIGIVDLAERKVVGRIAGLKKPQGVAYVKPPDLIYVASAGDGTVRWFKALDFAPVGQMTLDDDADNVRFDPQTNEVVVGYGAGGLAILDAGSGAKKTDIKLPAHPESFQLDPRGSRIFVNLPDARQIAVVDRVAGRKIAQWGTPARSNFPMAVDPSGARLFVVYRSPPTLAIFATETGSVVAQMATCGDADDVFFDAKRNRLYVSCGDGQIVVIQRDENNAYRESARIATNSGARTALFVPELDRLFLAVRSRGREPAAVWVFRPDS
jgi:DNA-binding beta-propeller fold protein YncE